VGESLKKETIDLLILIYRVNTRQDKSAVLLDAKERIEVIRLLIRLMKDLHQISIKNFVAINTIVEEVSKPLRVIFKFDSSPHKTNYKIILPKCG
jgi:hypothetical protein